MKMMTALALVLASAPAAYAASAVPAKESFIEQIGVHNNATVSQKRGNNNQATVQAGKFNSVLSTQKGGTAAAANNSANYQVGSDNTATISQKNGNNNQGTFQAGRANNVTTTQVSKLATGLNSSGNVQVGEFNQAATSQTNSAPNPLATGVSYTNNSFSTQVGTANSVSAKQTGGQNNQGTVQVGSDNLSLVHQADKAITPSTGPVVSGANTSFTGQFGENNAVITSQKTADASGAFSNANGYGNASASLNTATATRPASIKTDRALEKASRYSRAPITRPRRFRPATKTPSP